MALTSSDITKILNGVQKMLEHATNELRRELKMDISHLPTKDEFYNQTDKILKELKDMRDDHDSLSYRVSIHSDEIAALQKIHPSGAHASI